MRKELNYHIIHDYLDNEDGADIDELIEYLQACKKANAKKVTFKEVRRTDLKIAGYVEEENHIPSTAKTIRTLGDMLRDLRASIDDLESRITLKYKVGDEIIHVDGYTAVIQEVDIEDKLLPYRVYREDNGCTNWINQDSIKEVLP